MTAADRQRLAAILGMLGSAHAGERAAAALTAEAFRKKHALTWPELLALPPTEKMPEPEPPPPPPAAYQPRYVDREGLAMSAVYLGLMAAPITIAMLFRLFG